MKPRVTINLTEAGELEIWMNEVGRDQLVAALQGLGPASDHVHLGPDGLAEVETSGVAYRATDQILSWGKLLFRTDEWDREHFPHVLANVP